MKAAAEDGLPRRVILRARIHSSAAAVYLGVSASSSWLVRVVGRGHKVAALVILAAVLAIAALTGTAWAAGFARVREVLLHPHWPWLGVAVVAEACAYLGYTLAYREVVRAERGVELDVPRAAALVATGFGVFLQGGGFALDREALKRSGLADRDARARVLGLGALEYSVLAPATVVAALVVLLRGLPISGSLTLPWIIGVPVGAALALTALAFKRRLAGDRGWRRAVGHALRALELVLQLVRSPRKYPFAFTGISLYWLGDAACLWATLHAFSAHTPPVAQLVVGYATGYAITRRGLPLGGAGIVEALLPLALGWVGIPLAPAVVAVLAYRVINLWLPMVPALGGISALAGLERRGRPRHA
jgi:uncharacterized membrane protein YbhN (UPF0104 family)